MEESNLTERIGVRSHSLALHPPPLLVARMSRVSGDVISIGYRGSVTYLCPRIEIGEQSQALKSFRRNEGRRV